MNFESHWFRTMRMTTGHKGSFSSELRTEVGRPSKETMNRGSEESKSRKFFRKIEERKIWYNWRDIKDQRKVPLG